MGRKIYDDKEQAFNDIPRLKREVVPCLEMLMDDVFTLPLYFPFGYYEDTQQPFGEIKVKFSLSEIRPMISVGDWVMYYYFNAEIIDYKFIDEYKSKKDDIIKLFKMSAPVRDDKSLSITHYSPFTKPFNDELHFFTRICNTGGSLYIDKIIWDI